MTTVSMPVLTYKALSAVDTTTLPGRVNLHGECEGGKHHSPRPLILHEVTLRSGRQVWLCGVCQGNLAVYLHLMDHTDGKLPWALRREHPHFIRVMAGDKTLLRPRRRQPKPTWDADL